MLQMTWNNEAAANAQKWANQCIPAHSPADQRRTSTSGGGENLSAYPFESTWKKAFKSWQSEVKLFNFSNEIIDWEKVGHYTQVVWATSKEIGCGANHCPNNPKWKYILVCQYCPPLDLQVHQRLDHPRGSTELLLKLSCLHNIKFPLTLSPGVL
ncbi:cysteine-rich secretory protein 2 isoform X3 [Esox lucius]|nr:cysteine-rich secretory protein 2 isoform X3 [Esox lucius]XP_034146069.1 cysteine-rich secretory protein 2 isoform X3 [Esox lucius]